MSALQRKIGNQKPPKDNVAAEASGGQNWRRKLHQFDHNCFIVGFHSIHCRACFVNEKSTTVMNPQQTTETVDSAAVDDDDSMAADTAVVDPTTDDVEMMKQCLLTTRALTVTISIMLFRIGK